VGPSGRPSRVLVRQYIRAVAAGPVGAGSTGFVGREADIAALGDAVDAAMGGRGSLTLVCGEPGIGKTALVEHAAQAAADKGVVVRWATCWDGEGQPPYWPWLQVVRAELDGGLTGPGVAELLLGHGATGESDAARFELFDALARFLLGAAARAPRLVVLDDLHWADASSLRFLLFLTSQLRQAALAVVGTCRDVDVDPASPMLEVFPDLCRLSRVLSLDALGAPEIAALLEGFGAPAGPEEVADLSRQSGGNPLFASELARLGPAGLAGVDGVPLGLREVIGQRLRRFDDATMALMEAAAVLGQRFDVAELARMAGQAEADVLDRLAGPLAARLLRRADASSVGFAHDLVRRTLYDGMAAVQRAGWHGRAADALVAGGSAAADERAGRVAVHRVEAAVLGDRAAAVAACQAAADQARRALAHDEAAAYLRTAVRLCDEGPPGAAGTAELVLALAEAEWRAGRQNAAVAAAERALAEAQRTGDDVVFARAALACCLGSPVFDPRPDLVDLLEQARHRLQNREPALVARILARQSFLLLTVRPAEPEMVADQAVDAARRAGDDLALAEALQARHQAIWTEGRTEERAAIADELAGIAFRTGNRDLAVEATLMQFVIAMDTGDGDEVDRRLAEVTALATTLRRPLWRFYAATRRAAVALARGEHDDAERAIEEAQAVAPDGLVEAWAVLMNARFRLAVVRGDATTLASLAETLRTDFPLGPTTWTPGCQAALAMVVLGCEEQARSLVDRLIEQMDERGARLFSVLPGAFLLTEVCTRLGMTEHVPALYRVLAPHERAVANLAGGVQAFGPVAHALGCLAAAHGRTDVAVAHFATALAVADRMRSPAWAASTKAAWADVLATAGDVRGAARLRGEARAVAEALGLAQVLVAVGAPTLDPPAPSTFEARLRIEGDHWRVALGSEAIRLRDTKGLRFLAELVAHPGVERHALDLVAVTEGVSTEPGVDRRRIGDAGALLDPKAKEAYRRRLEDLRDDVAEAEAFHDDERAARAQAEIDALVQELSRAVGLRGRDRRAASAAERARVNVTRALRGAIARIEEVLPALGRHLDRCVRTGTFCVYEADGQLRVRVEPSGEPAEPALR